MLIEISIILVYLFCVVIQNSRLGYPLFSSVSLLVDLSMFIQVLILVAVFFVIRSLREMYKNERFKCRILFLIAGTLIAVINSMLSADGEAEAFTYLLLYSLPIFYCSIISIFFTMIFRRH